LASGNGLASCAKGAGKTDVQLETLGLHGTDACRIAVGSEHITAVNEVRQRQGPVDLLICTRIGALPHTHCDD